MSNIVFWGNIRKYHQSVTCCIFPGSRLVMFTCVNGNISCFCNKSLSNLHPVYRNLKHNNLFLFYFFPHKFVKFIKQNVKFFVHECTREYEESSKTTTYRQNNKVRGLLFSLPSTYYEIVLYSKSCFAYSHTQSK